MGNLNDLFQRKASLGYSSQEKHSGCLVTDGLLQLVRESRVVEADLDHSGAGRSQSVVIVVSMASLNDDFILHALRVR
jgi:hypothetical protein